MTTTLERTSTRRPSATRALIVVETKLLLREPLAIFWGLIFPALLMIIIGLVGSRPEHSLGGLRLVDTYEPIGIAFVLSALALQSMPTVLAAYREHGILRRLATTPAGALRLLAAQLVVNLCVALGSIAGVMLVARVGFDVALPRHPIGFVAELAALAASMIAIGLFIASVAPTGRGATAIGALLSLPMMFFAGLWIPQPLMPAALRRFSDFTPLGAGVHALQSATFGAGAPLSSLAVLLGYAVVGGLLAARCFSWQ